VQVLWGGKPASSHPHGMQSSWRLHTEYSWFSST